LGSASGSPGLSLIDQPNSVERLTKVIVGPSVPSEESVTAGYSKVLVTRLSVLPLSGGTTVKGFA
jgi:hypothetical protein